MTTIPDAYLAILRLLAERLRGMKHPWAITGSVGMALQGMALEPRDIDLQTDAPGAYALEARLREFVTEPVEERVSERIRSHFGALAIAGVRVEIMGAMQQRALREGGWLPAPDLPALIRRVRCAGLRLPVLDLAHEQRAYAAMGRAEKAARIGAFLRERRGGPEAAVRTRFPRPRSSRRGLVTLLRRPARRRTAGRAPGRKGSSRGPGR